MEKFWKVFDKGGTIAFYVLGVGAGLIALVVWLFSGSVTQEEAYADIRKSEEAYTEALEKWMDGEIPDEDMPTPCDIKHKMEKYVKMGLVDESLYNIGAAQYGWDNFAYNCASKKEVKKAKVESKPQPAPIVEQPQIKEVPEASCAAYSRASLELRNGLIDLETYNYLKATYEWDETICANQADDDANYMKEKLRKAKAKWRGEEEETVQPIVRESADYKRQKEEQARLEAMQAENRRLAEENRRLAEERARLEEERLNQAQFIEIPKNEVVDETAPVRQGDCSDPTLLKYTNMYENGLMSRIEYQDFVYSNGFDKCF